MADRALERETEELIEKLLDQGVSTRGVYRALGSSSPGIDKIGKMRSEHRNGHFKKVEELLKKFKDSGSLKGIIDEKEFEANPYLRILGVLYTARRPYKHRYIRYMSGQKDRNVAIELQDLLDEDMGLVEESGVTPTGKLYRITDLGRQLYQGVLDALGPDEK